MNTPQKLSLAGLRVLEFTYAFMGPTVGPLLAELGVAGHCYCASARRGQFTFSSCS
jgi:hypothetical protein